MPVPTPPQQRIAIVVDYQNIHLTAAEKFRPYGEPRHLSLIHPGQYADAVLDARATAQKIPELAAEAGRATVGAVYVYRGLPTSQENPEGYRRNLMQKSHWERDRRVHVEHRNLAYSGGGPPREKGIDVMVALKLITLARSAEFSTVILASHDTDLEPALDYAIKDARPRIETAGWNNCRRLHPTHSKVWHTFLGEVQFDASVDSNTYD